MANFCCSTVTKAVINNNLKRLSELIKSGERVDVQDNLGYTPLHVAARKLSSGCVNLLLRQADVPINVKSFEGFTSLYLACDNTNPPLRLITNLLKHGADPNLANNEGVTPLHVVCKTGNVQVAKLLYKYGADINIKDVDDDTPLHFAVHGGQLNIVDYLLKNKAECKLINNYGLNPLMMAIIHKNEDIFDLILQTAYNNLNAVGNRRESALTLAISTGNLSMVKKLLEFGANLQNPNAISPLAIPEIYEPDKFVIFKFIWGQLNHFTISDDKEFVLLLSTKLRIRKHFQHLKLFFESSANFKFRLQGIHHTMKHIFRVKNEADFPNELFFKENKKPLKRIITGLVYQGVDICVEDFCVLWKFLKCCPYRSEILKILLQHKDFILTEQIVFTVFLTNDVDSGLLLLQNIPNKFNINELFNMFLTTHKMEHLLFLLQHFTPNNDIIKKIIQFADRSKKTDCKTKLEGNFEGKVKNLKEIARDKARVCIRNNMQTNGPPMESFAQMAGKLNCPQDVKDILLFKKSVNMRLM